MGIHEPVGIEDVDYEHKGLWELTLILGDVLYLGARPLGVRVIVATATCTTTVPRCLSSILPDTDHEVPSPRREQNEFIT